MNPLFRLAAGWLVQRAAASAKGPKPASAGASARNDEAKSEKRTTPSGKSDPPTIGIVCWDKAVFTPLCDRLQSYNRLTGSGFELGRGSWQGKSIAVLVPLAGPIQPDHIRALAQGHRPALVILLATGTSTELPVGDCVLARSVSGPRGKMKFDFAAPTLPHVHLRDVGDAPAAVRVDAIDQIVASCATLALPTVVIVRLVEAPRSSKPGAARLARKAGRLAASLFARRGGIGRTWQEYSVTSAGIERQLDLALAFVAAK